MLWNYSAVAIVLNDLQEYRTVIRETDKKIMGLVKERLTMGSRVAEIKHGKGMPTIDTDAEQAAMNNIVQSAEELGIEKQFARRLGELLIEETVHVEDKGEPERSKDQLMKEMFERTQKLLRQGRKITRFEIGEPNFPPSKEILRGLNSTFHKNRVIGYGPASGLPELREVIASDLTKRHKTKIDAEQILITPGARFAIFAAITSYVSSLERVIIPQPAWPAYEECVNFVGGRVIPLRTTFDNDWDVNIDALEKEFEKGAKVLVLNSPCNPTGKVIGGGPFDRILELAAEYDVMVLSDEVYDRYIRTPTPSVLDKDYENFVYINSFSKQFSLTGWRIGYLVTSKEKALRIRRVLQTAITCVPEFTQNAVLAAMKTARGEAQRQIKAILSKVDLTCRELNKIDVSFHKPEGAFYVFPKANKANFDSLAFARNLLEQHGVSVTPGQSFGDYSEFFRLAVSLPRSQIPSAIRAIGTAIDSWP
jgi:aspartate aminotransferase